MRDRAIEPGDPASGRTSADEAPPAGSPGSRLRRRVGNAAKAAACAASFALFFAWLPSPIDAVAWEAGPSLQLPGLAAMGDVEAVTPVLRGPEAILFHEDGTLRCGLGDGGLYGGGLPAVGGRPLGLAAHPELGLLIANHPRGLQRIGAGGVEGLATEAEGGRIEFANGVAVAGDGSVYFTDSNDTFNLAHGYTPPFGAYDMLEMRPRGRLLRYDPIAKETSVVLRELHFPNGLALSRDGASVFVAETFRCRVLKVDLATHAAEAFVGGLPGYPDNLAVDAETGLLWVAMGVRRAGLHDWVRARPWLREQVAKLPAWVWRRPRARGLVIAIDERGQVQHVLEDAAGELGILTSAVPRGQWLYLGSLGDAPVVRVRKPE